MALAAVRPPVAQTAVTVTIYPLTGIPDVERNDDIGSLICDSLTRLELSVTGRDVVVITHKIVSKAEGAVVPLPDDGPDAHRQVVEDEAVEIVRRRGDLVIAITSHGFVCANAGVDRSNTHPGTAVLLPRDPDHSAQMIRARIGQLTGSEPAIVITDTFGRPWRRGLVDVAIGVAGLPAILDLRGTLDGYGRQLDVTEIALVDELAGAADLVMGKSDGIPAALVTGLNVVGDGRASDLVRPASEDLFR